MVKQNRLYEFFLKEIFSGLSHLRTKSWREVSKSINLFFTFLVPPSELKVRAEWQRSIFLKMFAIWYKKIIIAIQKNIFVVNGATKIIFFQRSFKNKKINFFLDWKLVQNMFIYSKLLTNNNIIGIKNKINKIYKYSIKILNIKKDTLF